MGEAITVGRLKFLLKGVSRDALVLVSPVAEGKIEHAETIASPVVTRENGGEGRQVVILHPEEADGRR